MCKISIFSTRNFYDPTGTVSRDLELKSLAGNIKELSGVQDNYFLST